ncbi:hypothetical protein JR065_01270 [Xanthomonas sp. AmX2]|uniref:hypothetical protein n=1 Tax=Xanthomonas sp. TaxID=29446 RepID=UPI00197F6380|nr:hypothetical protein [Xanthomonas sp.]MBN6148957.1 hypothetical protein [Xanthomonas sp.]
MQATCWMLMLSLAVLLAAALPTLWGIAAPDVAAMPSMPASCADAGQMPQAQAAAGADAHADPAMPGHVADPGDQNVYDDTPMLPPLLRRFARALPMRPEPATRRSHGGDLPSWLRPPCRRRPVATA